RADMSAVPGDLVTLGASDSGREPRARRFCPHREARDGSSKAAKEPITVPRRIRTMQTKRNPDTITIKISPNDKSNPAGKLADAELHFVGDSALAGLKLIGFSIWERRGGGGRNVTFPARQYAVNGERRSFALLRPIVDTTAQGALRDAI